MSQNNIERLLVLVSPFWMGRTYDPFLKNCNNFTKYFLKLILVGIIDYPAYINRICKYSHIFSSFYPPIKRLYGNLNIRETSGSVSHLFEGINNFLKKNSNFSSDSYDTQSLNNSFEKGIIINRPPVNSNNLIDEEKYLSEKEKDKKKANNETSSLQESNNQYSSLLNEDTINRINTYSPKIIRYMIKDPYLLPLNYSSIYITTYYCKPYYN